MHPPADHGQPSHRNSLAGTAPAASVAGAVLVNELKGGTR